ncbi:outer membrane protein [Natronospira proteinivora]|uniref:Protein CyaE n=1 Tax=Natronospira proteinivora TaxID=1807133 RepID=A0ABT1GFC6_9GAMM|nr:TolC family outer membrane protein [Natronospira proteinivora]MCP1728632.1 outer membrane protein [Natronospira proteinivora]
MSPRFFSLGLALGTALALGSAPALAQADNDTMTLIDVYQLAVDNDPAIKEARANRDAAQQAWPLERANVLPQLSLSAEYSTGRQEAQRQTVGEVQLPDPVITHSDTTTLNLTLNQTLFDWGRFQALGRARSEVAAAEAEYETAMQDLVIRSAEAYFDLLAALDEQASAQANEQAIERQKERAERRFEVGLVAITDVQEARAAYDNAVANRIDAERTVNLRRESLREIIGIYPGQLAAPVEDMTLSRPDPADPEAWSIQAQSNNLEVIAARFDLQAAESRLSEARAEHYPTLNFSASYNDFEQDEDAYVAGAPDMRETGRSVSDSYSFGLSLEVPIFQGGRVVAQTSQARSRMLAETSRVERLRRQAERQARDAYLGLLSERSRVQALAQAVESNQTALTSTQAGFEVGTRTTVDVLDARQALFQAQTSYARSKYDFLLNKLRLKAAVGDLGMVDIEEINVLLGARPGEFVEDVEVDPDELDTEGAVPPES